MCASIYRFKANYVYAHSYAHSYAHTHKWCKER